MNRIKEILDQKGIKQTWLAEKMGTSKIVVNLWCNNKNQPSLNKLNKIALVLSVDVRELIIPSNMQNHE
jgi:putative transcriptional regulator